MSIEELFRLNGRVSVVIGGARDLGLDMAQALGEAGSDLVITSRTLASAEKAIESLKTTCQGEILPLALDVCDSGQVTAVAEAAGAWKGRIDVLVNNAGGGLGLIPTNLFERKPEDVRQLIDTNLVETLFCCQAFGKIMAEQGHGSIINIASIAGMVGRDRQMYEQNQMHEQPIDYAAAKAGVIGMTQDLAGFLSPLGIRVNAISPGGFERGQPEGFVKAYNARTPLGRMGKDGVDLKGAALFLASSASDYVTGVNLAVDGGFTIWH